MNRTRSLIVTVAIMALSLVGLYACGGDNPTATPPPPTATPAPPTATVVPTAAPKAASAADLQLIQAAFAQAKDLTSYHFTIDVQPSAFITQPIKAAGDYQAPNMTYIKGTIGSLNIEQVVIGDKVFVKGADGKYTLQEKQSSSSSASIGFDPNTIVSGGNPIGSLGSTFGQIKTYKYMGDETVNGVQTRRFTFNLDMAEMMQGQDMGGLKPSDLPNLGGGSLWIDPVTKNVEKLDFNIDMGPLMELFAKVFSAMGGTPTPGGAQPTPFPSLPINMNMVITQQNDPSIKVPVTDEMKQAASAATTPTISAMPESTVAPATPQSTPQAMSTPEGMASPEVTQTQGSMEGQTPAAAPTTGDTSGLGGTGGGVVTGSMGQELKLGDVKITVNDVSRTSSGNLPPPDGKEYVVITVALENTGTADNAVSGLLSFVLLDSAGKEQTYALGVKYGQQMLDTVLNGNLKPGQKVTGLLGYEVAQGASGLTLKFTPSFIDNKSYVSIKLDK